MCIKRIILEPIENNDKITLISGFISFIIDDFVKIIKREVDFLSKAA